jgi:flavin-dependent dehydrogenase
VARVHDVIIVGAGPAGATLAYLLASNGWRVGLVDPGIQPGWRTSDLVPPSARPMLAALGLAEYLMTDPEVGRVCLGVQRTWGSSRVTTDDYMARPWGSGIIIRRAAFDAMLVSRAVAAGAVRILGRRVLALRHDAGAWKVTFAPLACGIDGAATTLTAPFIVDATGRAAALARRLGAVRRVADRLVAIVARLPNGEHASASDPVWLRVAATRHGWWYALAGSGGTTDLVAVTDPANRRAVGTESAAAAWMWSAKGTSMPPPARKPARQSPLLRRVVDASSACLDRISGPGWLAVGDAASAFDPITSQGMSQALASALAGAHAIRDAADGSREALAGYADAVRATWIRTEAGRRHVYRTEQRFRVASFWAARRAAVPVSGA